MVIQDNLTLFLSLYVFLFGDPDLCKKASDLLLKEYNIYVQPINYPTVPRGTERLRVTPTPLHNTEMINYFIDSIKKVWSNLNLNKKNCNEKTSF